MNNQKDNPKNDAMNNPKRKDLPASGLTITLKGEDFHLKVPNVGGFADIEISKMELSRGRQTSMLLDTTASSKVCYAMISAVATLEILIPDINDRLNVRSLMSIPPQDFTWILKEYVDKLDPWLSSWVKYLDNPLD